MIHECPSCGGYFTDNSLSMRQRVQFKVKCKRCKKHASLSTVYGISIQDYDDMLIQQGGFCAICGEPPKRKALVVDHDHVTGKVRALLCHSCNTGLGHFYDSPAKLRAAAIYLERHRAPESPE